MATSFATRPSLSKSLASGLSDSDSGSRLVSVGYRSRAKGVTLRALITGATGFVGRRLLEEIEDPVVLSRNAQRAVETLGDVEAHAWDGLSAVPPEALEGVETIFHLAGEPVAEGRWTAEKKKRILESRVESTRQLVEAMASRSERPRVLVSASAVGWYGDRGDEVVDESASAGDDFLAQVCMGWEAEARKASDLGVRVVLLRIGLVLGPGGGAIAKLLPLFKRGLGSRLASGRQWMPWVHLEDVVNLALFAARHDEIQGPMNAVAPGVVTNTEFTKTLAGVLNRGTFLPVPEFALRLIMGDFATSLLASQRVTSRVAPEAGYEFGFTDLERALQAIVTTS